MIYLLSPAVAEPASAPGRAAITPKASALFIKGRDGQSGNKNSQAKPDFTGNVVVQQKKRV
jgi:hypothetical protein